MATLIVCDCCGEKVEPQYRYTATVEGPSFRRVNDLCRNCAVVTITRHAAHLSETGGCDD